MIKSQPGAIFPLCPNDDKVRLVPVSDNGATALALITSFRFHPTIASRLLPCSSNLVDDLEQAVSPSLRSDVTCQVQVFNRPLLAPGNRI